MEPWHYSWDTGASRTPAREGPRGTGQSWGLLSSPCFLGCPAPCSEDPPGHLLHPRQSHPKPCGRSQVQERGGHRGATAAPRQSVIPSHGSEQGTAVLSAVPSATTLVLRSQGKMMAFWGFRTMFGGHGAAWQRRWPYQPRAQTRSSCPMNARHSRPCATRLGMGTVTLLALRI